MVPGLNPLEPEDMNVEVFCVGADIRLFCRMDECI